MNCRYAVKESRCGLSVWRIVYPVWIAGMVSRYRLPAWMFNPLLFYINRLVAVRAREQEVMCLEAKVQAPTQAAPLEAVQRLEAQALAEAAVVAWRQRKARRRNRKQGAVEVAAGQGGVAEVAQA